MKYKRILIILCAVLFFLTALTIYVNRIVFPQLIKKIAIQRMEESLNRKVEIGSIHFNWFKGFIVDQLKIYEKDSDLVFAQADQVSFGVLIFPGVKHFKISIPFINVKTPSVRLIRLKADTWNFSDLASSAAGTPGKNSNNPPRAASKSDGPDFKIAWGGITITDGKFLVEDQTRPVIWNEYFEHIDLKLSLSYKSINYELTADIPGRQGFIGAKVDYEPFSQKTHARLHLKNIDTASYLALVQLPDINVKQGILKDIDLDINYSKEKISAQGDVLMNNLDISNASQSFKGDVEIHHLDGTYNNGYVTARGEIAINHMQTMVPDLDCGGSVQAHVLNFELTPDSQVNFNGSITAQEIFIRQKDRQINIKEVALDNIQVNRDLNKIQSASSIMTQGLIVQWPQQRLSGDLTLKNVSLHMQDVNDITLESDLTADNLSTDLADQSFSTQHLSLTQAKLHIENQKDVSLNTQLSLDNMSVRLNNLFAAGSLSSDQFSLKFIDHVIKANTILNFSKGKFIFDHHKTIEAAPRLELDLNLPLADSQNLTYKGSLTFSDASLYGFAPIKELHGVDLDADFQNDQATINALGLNILNTNLHITGEVKNFKDPWLNITAEAEELDLAQISQLFPQATAPLGLNFEGSSMVKVKFEGRAADPLAGNILAVASFKKASAYSQTLHQKVKNITGIIEATPNTLIWRDLTATYGNSKYNLSGSLRDFKNPKITANISGPQLEIKADISKDPNIININDVSGKYLNTSFNSHGLVTLIPGFAPAFDIHLSTSLLLEEFIKELPLAQQKALLALNPTGAIDMSAEIKGTPGDWRKDSAHADISSPLMTLLGYKLNAMKISVDAADGKIKNLVFDGKLYDGTVHAIGSMDFSSKNMPYDLALNIDNTDMHELKEDSPFKMQEINGKFYFTSMIHGTIADFKNNLHATGSLAIRDGFLAEFNLFKGLLSVLNDALHLGEVEITDVESNFTIDNQKISTDNLRLKGPTIVLLGKGWINFDQYCDLDMTIDLSSGIVPAVAHDLLSTLDIRIYDKINDPKFKKKISVPQVINSLIKNFLE